MIDLVLVPTGEPDQPWCLQIRYHREQGPPEFVTVGRRITEKVARDIVRAGAPTWLFGDPDPPASR